MRQSKVALVTGGTKGIGLEIARQLSSSFKVITLARSGADINCDLSNHTDLLSLLSTIDDVDVLVNNAAAINFKPTYQMDYDDWDYVDRVNVRAPFLLSRAFLPMMTYKGWGRIINISSIAGRACSNTASAAYTASKYALIGLTKHLAKEYAEYGITVNCVCPSQTKTAMLSESRSQEEIDEFANSLPIKRLAKPEEVASIVKFLASREASYLNGSVIDVNGGQL